MAVALNDNDRGGERFFDKDWDRLSDRNWVRDRNWNRVRDRNLKDKILILIKNMK